MQKLCRFYQNCFFFFWNFNRSRLFFDQSKLIQNFWVNLYLFRLIEPMVLINQKSCGTFFKTSFSNGSNTFSKSFLTFLSPYDSVKANLLLFLSFLICLFARFSSLQASKSILPLLLHLFSCFHAYIHAFHWDFWNFSNWGFWWFKPLFLKLIIRFYSYNVINMIFDV